MKVCKETPIVILLDLDNTIQGDISHQLQEYNLLELMRNNVPGCSKLRQNKKDVMNDMRKGLLRPYFKRFIIKMKQRFPNVEFFVYTASESNWAHYIIKIIEQTLELNLNHLKTECLRYITITLI